jgi:hypothetical protein
LIESNIISMMFCCEIAANCAMVIRFLKALQGLYRASRAFMALRGRP